MEVQTKIEAKWVEWRCQNWEMEEKSTGLGDWLHVERECEGGIKDDYQVTGWMVVQRSYDALPYCKPNSEYVDS